MQILEKQCHLLARRYPTPRIVVFCVHEICGAKKDILLFEFDLEKNEQTITNLKATRYEIQSARILYANLIDLQDYFELFSGEIHYPLLINIKHRIALFYRNYNLWQSDPLNKHKIYEDDLCEWKNHKYEKLQSLIGYLRECNMKAKEMPHLRDLFTELQISEPEKNTSVESISGQLEKLKDVCGVKDVKAIGNRTGGPVTVSKKILKLWEKIRFNVRY